MADDDPRPIPWLKAGGHDAEAEILALPKRPRERALAVLGRLSQLPRTQLGLKKTHIDDIWEKKHVVPEGALRILFIYGKTDLWCIGGFVKRNDSEGNNLLKRRYVAVANIARNL